MSERLWLSRRSQCKRVSSWWGQFFEALFSWSLFS